MKVHLSIPFTLQNAKQSSNDRSFGEAKGEPLLLEGVALQPGGDGAAGTWNFFWERLDMLLRVVVMMMIVDCSCW